MENSCSFRRQELPCLRHVAWGHFRMPCDTADLARESHLELSLSPVVSSLPRYCVCPGGRRHACTGVTLWEKCAPDVDYARYLRAWSHKESFVFSLLICSTYPNYRILWVRETLLLEHRSILSPE
jgi:hypothetical protein